MMMRARRACFTHRREIAADTLIVSSPILSPPSYTSYAAARQWARQYGEQKAAINHSRQIKGHASFLCACSKMSVHFTDAREGPWPWRGPRSQASTFRSSYFFPDTSFPDSDIRRQYHAEARHHDDLRFCRLDTSISARSAISSYKSIAALLRPQNDDHRVKAWRYGAVRYEITY